MTYIKLFNQIGSEQVEQAGGKGASLGEMTKAGISVPPGFVVLANAFDRFLQETDLGVEIQAILDQVDVKIVHTIDQASDKIQGLILGVAMPDDLAKDIRTHFDELGCKYVAVRSSATSEDSASAAWAGQLDTFLNTIENELIESVKKCWSSLFTTRAIFYRSEQGLKHHHISVAVVIQKMVQSEMSGIAFSVHPVTQDMNQLIIEAGFGLGEAIVSGMVTPDSYVVQKDTLEILDLNVNEQGKKLIKSTIKEGENEWIDLSKQEGGEQVLSKTQIAELSELVLTIENHYGFPCDIEWAYEDGQFYITQSRPITTLMK